MHRARSVSLKKVSIIPTTYHSLHKPITFKVNFFTHSVNTNCPYFVPDIVVDTLDTAVTNTDTVLVTVELTTQQKIHRYHIKMMKRVDRVL